MGRMAQQLQIGAPGRHIFLCCDQTVPKCCTKDSGMQSWDFLKARLKVGGGAGGAHHLRVPCLGDIHLMSQHSYLKGEEQSIKNSVCLLPGWQHELTSQTLDACE